MFDNFSNLIFIAVAVAIFIGRTLTEAKRKKKAPPPPPQRPAVPALHSEEEPATRPLPKPKPKPAPKKQQPALAPRSASVIVDTTPPAKTPVRVGPIAPVQAGFTLNVNHLSPMQQAVVFSEILGPPKGLS